MGCSTPCIRSPSHPLRWTCVKAPVPVLAVRVPADRADAAVAASWTIRSEADGYAAPVCMIFSYLDLRAWRYGPACAGRASPKAEPDADAGPAAP